MAMDESAPPTPGVTQPKAPTPKRWPSWVRAWPIYILTGVVVWGTYYFVTHRQPGQGDTVLPPSVKLEANIEIQFGDVTMQGRQKGVQRWTIRSPNVKLSKDGRFTYFEPDPTGNFVNLKDWNNPDAQPSGQPDAKTRSLTWKADKAQFDSFSEDLAIDGHTLVTTDENDVIKTAHIDYKSRTKVVDMPKPVDINMKNGTKMTADALTANSDAELMELKGHVVLDTKVNDEEKM
jgi:LPS export ABC transporter protein LptC